MNAMAEALLAARIVNEQQVRQAEAQVAAIARACRKEKPHASEDRDKQ